MADKINWQEHNGTNQQPSRWPVIGNWIKHISKISFCLIFVLIAFFYLVLPQIKANYYYGATRCLVSASKMEPVSEQVANSGVKPQFLLVYEVNNKIYTNWAYDILNNIITNPDASAVLTNEIKTGQYYTCWYDKTDPHKVILKRGWDTISLIFFSLTLIVLLNSITSFCRWFSKKKEAP